MRKEKLYLPLLIGFLVCSFPAMASPVMSTVDTIATGARTGFMDFEPMPAGTGLGPTFSQGGITVTQVNGQNDIWTTCGTCMPNDDSKSWYPDGGDFGWTEISLTGGGDFSSVGFDVGSGFGGSHYLQFELLNNGISVLLGELTFAEAVGDYLGFSGGGFDLVRVRNSNYPWAPGSVFGDGTFNAFAVDNIEIAASVPLPAPLVLMALGFAGLGYSRRSQ